MFRIRIKQKTKEQINKNLIYNLRPVNCGLCVLRTELCSVSDPYSLNPDPDKNLNPDPVPDPAPDPAPDPSYFLTLSEIFFPHNFLVFHMSIWIRIQGGKN